MLWKNKCNYLLNHKLTHWHKTCFMPVKAGGNMQYRTSKLAVVIAIALMTSMATTSTAEQTEYKPYQNSSAKEVYYEIVFSEEKSTIRIADENQTTGLSFFHDELEVKRDHVLLVGEVLFDSEGLHLDGKLLPYDNITDTRVQFSDEETAITFFTRTGDEARIGRIRRGNLIEPVTDIIVTKDEFVRGIVFSVTSDVEIYGEVNKDVISLFGDVFVGPNAVVRGDVIAASGDVNVTKDASVYGEVYSETSGREGRRHRFREPRNRAAFEGSGYYNRVDGLAISLKGSYSDRDSLLPSAWVSAGYAFESERWRYELGFEQTVLRSPAIAVGGSVFRRLETNDNWLLTTSENTFLALVACEDFMDYHEAEGAHGYLRIRPAQDMSLEAGYQWRETKWLPAQADLWAVFGRDKEFRRNFSSVDLPYRIDGAAEIDSTTNAGMYARFDWDTRDTAAILDRSAWAVTGTLDWSHPDLRSDFDYRRYTLSVRRYQQIHRRSMLLLRGMFGGSDGYLPMYERFYLGGLGSLRGYKHKEYIGTRFWMANAEYRIRFPRTDLAASLFWDIGQIANDAPLDGDAEVRNSLGASVYIGDDFKVSLARRLDRSEDNGPKFYVRLAHVL